MKRISKNINKNFLASQGNQWLNFNIFRNNYFEKFEEKIIKKFQEKDSDPHFFTPGFSFFPGPGFGSGTMS